MPQIIVGSEFAPSIANVWVFLDKQKSPQTRNNTKNLWQYRLWSFSRGRDAKLERFLAKNLLQSNKIIESGELE